MCEGQTGSRGLKPSIFELDLRLFKVVQLPYDCGLSTIVNRGVNEVKSLNETTLKLTCDNRQIHRRSRR